MEALVWIVGLLLAGATFRRLRFVFARRPAPPDRGAKYRGPIPEVTIAVAARNEQERIHDLLGALARLDYPSDRIEILFVDDASEDTTAAILETWCRPRPNARLRVLERRHGKSAALNTLLAGGSRELIVCFDADQRPRPESLRRLVETAADDPKAGAVCAYRSPIADRQSLAASYAILESRVHQLVIQEGKDRLGLNPPSSGGGCLYRRSALEEVSWFPDGSLSEDVEVTLAMAAAGWRTRFLREAVVDTRVVDTLEALRRQRARWTVGLYRSAGRARGPEAWLTASGYADRILFAGAVGLAAAGVVPVWLPLIYVIGPVVAVCTALRRSGGESQWWRHAATVFALFPLDVFWTLRVSAENVLRRDLGGRLERNWRGDTGGSARLQRGGRQAVGGRIPGVRPESQARKTI